jgi:hypothetical protein
MHTFSCKVIQTEQKTSVKVLGQKYSWQIKNTKEPISWGWGGGVEGENGKRWSGKSLGG